MKFSFLVNSRFNLEDFDSKNCHELVFSMEKISRRSLVTKDELSVVASKTQLRRVCEFDVLPTESDFNHFQTFFESIDKNLYDSVRVQDFGVANWVFENTDKKIQLNLETGHHNFQAIEIWLNLLGERLEKIVLSYELPIDVLKSYAKKIRERGVEVEVLGLGAILLFYSPRELISRLGVSGKKVKADSLESPHKGFDILENDNGTFMYHLKDLNLLDFKNDIDFISLLDLRIELKNYMKFPFLENIEFNLENYPKKTFKGYSLVNKSDVIFKKLKNQNLDKLKNFFVGEVISVSKPDYLLVNCSGQHHIKFGESLKLISPEGIEKVIRVSKIRDINNNEIDNSHGQRLVMIPYLKKMTPKTVVFLNRE